MYRLFRLLSSAKMATVEFKAFSRIIMAFRLRAECPAPVYSAMTDRQLTRLSILCAVRLRLFDAQLALHLFEGYALGFGIGCQHHDELQGHHGGEKYERSGLGMPCHPGKDQ